MNRIYSFNVLSVLILPFFMMLFSCAVEPIKTNDVKDKSIEVSSAVEDDFHAALKFLKESSYDEAVSLLEKVIEQEKRLSAPYVNLGMAYSRLGDVEKSESILQKAIEIEPSHPSANNELALIFRKSGRFNEAKIAYERALAIHPNYLPGIKNLGILCDIYMHDFDCALKQFEKYKEFMPEDKTMGIWVSDLKRRVSK